MNQDTRKPATHPSLHRAQLVQLLSVLITAALCLGACVTKPPITARERCAIDGLTLASSRRAAAGGSIGNAVGLFRGATHSCTRPRTAYELCEARALGAGARLKDEFSTAAKNVSLAVGWVLYVLPGLALYLIYEHGKSDVEERARRATLAEWNACRKEPDPFRPRTLGTAVTGP